MKISQHILFTCFKPGNVNHIFIIRIHKLTDNNIQSMGRGRAYVETVLSAQMFCELKSLF